MTMIVDCSIIIRLLSSRDGDDLLRQRLARTVHAPALIDAEISSVVRGLTITAKPNVRITPDRAEQMLADYPGLRIARHPMQPLQARASELRANLTAYDPMSPPLSERLPLPLLPDDANLAAGPGHPANIRRT